MNSAIISPLITIAILSGMFISFILVMITYHQGVIKINKEQAFQSLSVMGVVMLSWIALAVILARNGFFAARPSIEFSFPRIVYVFIPLIIGMLAFHFSYSFKNRIYAIPIYWLVGVQFIRIMGAVFLVLFLQQDLPAAFALPAGIGDVLVGTTAPLVAYVYYVRGKSARSIVMIWNIFGIADLVIAVTVGFLTSPTPFQLLARNNPNILISNFPLVLIPAFAVPLSLLLHFYTFKKLKNKVQ